MNSDEETLKKLAQQIAANMPPPIPLEIELWSAREVAAYLKRTPRQIAERYAHLPGFPAAVRLPAADDAAGRQAHRSTASRGRARPLWPAKDVIAWAMRYQDKAA